MPPLPANLRRHFLTWARPLVPQAVDWLAGSWRGEGPLDLSRVLAIVPTRQSGRRLREALAGHAAVHGQAVFAPRVLTPDALVAQDLGPDVASRLESLLAWVAVFRELELESFRHVLPVDPPARNFSWALRLAQEFSRLQFTLAETGLRLADVPGRAGADFVEAERWHEIAQLERRHEEKLAAERLRNPQAARIAAAHRPVVDDRFERIVVLAVADPQPLALARLAVLAQSRPIDVVVFAPPEEAGVFDEWGRPLPAAWEHRALALDHFAERAHLCADPAMQAARIAAVAARYPQPEGALALGIADPEVTPLLENELMRVDRPSFNPEGRPMRNESLYHLLASLSALAREPAFTNVEALARCPDFLAYMRKRVGESFSAAHWLARLDQLRADHLPGDLDAARELAARHVHFSAVLPGLEAMERLRARLGAGTFAGAVTDALRELFADRQLDLACTSDARWQDAAVAWAELLRDAAALDGRFGRIATADWWELALRLFGEQSLARDKPAGALELQGWLELLWEDAPHLAVAGLNDGRVPEAVVEDAFLPESLRQRLGLKTNAARFARDAYILQAIAAGRNANGGRLDLFFGKTSASGDPLRPSRLLLRCTDAELPDRIAFLFRAPELADTTSSWTRAWKMKPRAAPPPARVAVTALRRYLQCPFRFYLRHVLRMESVDPLKSELDAFDFGTLCHTALERIGLEPALRDCTDGSVLRTELLHQLDRAARARYGKNPSLPVLVQLESARQRLGKLAELQAAERAAGWVIAQVERPFAVEICGLTVRGKIDRIDRHADTGAIRVLDYKTSDTPVSPAEAHLRGWRLADSVRDWAKFDLDGRPRMWVDLQLPLYLHSLAAEFPGRIACGYFNLPKASGETTLAVWDDYTPELHDAAMRCAQGACTAIRAGEYWPPNETLRAERDECAALFHHGVADSVEWESCATR